MFSRLQVVALIAAAAGVESFSTLPMFSSSFRAPALRGPRMASAEVGNVKDIPPGERLITKVGDDDVMVVNHKGDLYALSPKCPHLGLPMKTGEITDDGPCITCKFHGSKFKLTDGSCVEWSESVMGLPGTKAIGNLIGKVGGAKDSPATVYKLEVEESGAIIVDTA
eukprot:CAMPEP_0202832852 /NCGR_PEP_ID=MMETSP1389-20130828/21794_1 /ASSEMBLY_ACC=CAM_ASM_000865 /TAXON_ID=302021 /ORGANISM="Rhodomonas sp., Strain CCMP768" /LENGTH=166 /DNA_ID=CAMNT_0049507117 /DNA_START=37 /DNA_END=537 /DNA_ORIENTATION=+